MPEWSENEALWQAMEPALCAPARLALAGGDVSAILACVPAPPAARVLDSGCGPGAHAIAFAHHGHSVTGVDTSRRLLDRARAAAQEAHVHVEWVQADMRDFRRPADFDLVCSLYASFGYFDDEQNRRVLENIHASLVPGGVLVLDIVGREVAARHGQESRQREVDGVLYVEHSHTADDGSNRISDWIVVREGTRSRFRVKQRLYSGTELREILVSVGFAGVRLAGGLDGETPYDESARRLVAIARMPS